MLKKIQNFVKSVFVKFVIINVGCVGVVSLDVIQEVEYVKEEVKMVYLFECLQKIFLFVFIFVEKKVDVDVIYEYLLFKGVEVVVIYGGKDQEEWIKVIEVFWEGKKDVLVVIDVVFKGLDFFVIQYVINYDMLEEIENYVYWIGCIGCLGNIGIVIIFINKVCDELVLMDFKVLLLEVKQKVLFVLQVLYCGDEFMLDIGGECGCVFCGGLGYWIIDCFKFEVMQIKQVSNIGCKDYLVYSFMDF